ncbi:hypothetical protein V8C86DRAFT_2709929 [Haematococcus lacustris]|nr:hypothetical protein QJQ45_029586 [Haematococcus lacustris]
MGKWFGPDIVALSVPIVMASLGFTAMIGRAFVLDPEWSRGCEWYEKPEADKIGTNYRMQYQQFFRTGSKGLFPNKVEIIS